MTEGDRVRLADDYIGGGQPGAVYRYIGGPSSVDLGTVDYSPVSLTTASGEQSVKPGVRVKVQEDHTAGGIANAVYRYNGSDEMSLDPREY